MNRFTRYNRILAGALAAALVVTNLSANAQVVLASETEQNVTVTESVVETQDLTEAPAAASEETPAAEVAETPVSESSVETPTTEPPAESTEIPTVEESGSVTETDTSGSTGSDETTTDSTTNKEENTSEKAETGSTETKENTEQSEGTKAEEKDEDEENKEQDETESKFEVTKTLDCSQEHEHMADCYVYTDADGQQWTLTCTEDHEHTKDCYKARETEQDSDKAEVIEEDGDTHVVTYETETEGITVKAEALNTAFPEGVTLEASRIEDDDALTTVTEAIDESDVTYDDYLALDVHFNDADGNEIEPKGAVKVTFEFAEELLPSDVDTDSLSVAHLNESGDSTKVETVADTSDDDSTGTVQVTAADDEQSSSSDTARNVSAEFEVRSFSTFAIYWKVSDSDKAYFTVHATDESGDELAITAVPASDISDTFTLTKSGSYYQSTWPLNLNDYTNTKESFLQYYTWNEVHENSKIVLTTAGNETKTYQYPKSIRLLKDTSGNWYCKVEYYTDSNRSSYNDNGTYGEKVSISQDADGNSKANVDLYLVYERITAEVQYNLTYKINDRSGSGAVTVIGNGTTPATKEYYIGSTITLPELDNETATGSDDNEYTFMGWIVNPTGDTFTVAQSYSDTGNTIYRAGDTCVIESANSGNTDKKVTVKIYALWSRKDMATATFWLRLDGVIPSRTASSSSSLYTDKISQADCVRIRRWNHDASAGELITDMEGGKEVRSYISNGITDALDTSQLPTNNDIQKAATAKAGKGFNYDVAVNEDTGALYVSRVYIEGSGGTTGGSWTSDKNAVSKEGLHPGDELYVQWYTEKYQDEENGGYTYHIDGVLLVKDRISIHYDANTSGATMDIPSGYQVAEDTTITVGISGQASPDGSHQVLEPRRPVDSKGQDTSQNTSNDNDQYIFLGWNTAADGSGTTYASGAEITVDEDLTLYAMWSLNGGKGNLKITKTVTGDNVNPDEEFEITVSVPEAQLDGVDSYTVYKRKADGTIEHLKDVSFGKSIETFTIKSGEYIMIENLPDGASYEVQERSLDGTKYRVTYRDANGQLLANGKGTIVDKMTREINIYNSPRIVKTGVTTDIIPWVALTSLLVAGSVMILLYGRFRRDLTRNR